MTRNQIEKNILATMGLLTSAGAIKTSVTASARTEIQTKIAAVLQTLGLEKRWKYRRKRWGVCLKAPVTCTATAVLGASTVTISGATPAADWQGGYLAMSWMTPRRVASVAAQVATLEAPASVSGALAATFYYSGALLASDVQTLKEGSARVLGAGPLEWMSFEDMEEAIERGATVGDPTHYSVFDAAPSATTGYSQKVLNVFPFPGVVRLVSFGGWRKLTALGTDGTATGDDAVPDFPAEYHESLLLPMVRLAMCDHPGFELVGKEQEALMLQVKLGRAAFEADQLAALEEDSGPMTPRYS
jgi:hypothetical protein